MKTKFEVTRILKRMEQIRNNLCMLNPHLAGGSFGNLK
jgi:hypothetical protein